MKKALGKGLNALIPGKNEEIINIEVSRIVPNPEQPRKAFNEDSLNELAASIAEKGIIQPIVVYRKGDGSFEILAGERRWRASIKAGLKEVPCLVKDEKPDDSIELSLIENIQRENLNAMETADAFRKLVDEFYLKQEDIAKRVGKDRATIANYLRLLNLPDEVKKYVSTDKLSMGHAKAILSLTSEEERIEIANRIVQETLSVREAERLCKKSSKSSGEKGKKASPVKDPQIKSIEEELIQSLGAKVKIDHKTKKGKIEIEYYSLDELNRLLDLFRSL